MREPELTEDQRLIQETARSLAEEHFRPLAARADREYAPPVGNLRILAEHGFCGAFIPEEYGGAGLGLFDTVIVMEQVARNCANTAILLSGTDGATPRSILHLGTEEQKRRWLPRFARAETLAAWSMSEPEAGSDVAAVRTRARKDGDSYIIDGAKTWCSGAQVSDLFLVLVRLSDEPGMRGVGAVLVERGTPGFTIGNHLDMIGLRATGMAGLNFDACRIPADNLIVPAGGMRHLFKVLDADRIAGNPTVCLGVAGAALDGATAYLRERKQFGKALSEFQGLQWRLADMAIDIEAGRALLWRAARRIDANEATPMDASVAKTFVNEMSVRVTNAAMQLAGGYGLSEEFPFERYFRDVRGMSVGYGTTEIHRNTIAREVLEGRYAA
ncbi:acyl-CoA dehydrogenase family protein [Muricoccus aerilatus]|uniref:acyl-CoA dehydrogenase family protein n=1 Tax=Muricoccus aerilatus TaxID=452982 RepID=UPI0005C1B9C1|nr:acyl-CoA dehydrogenase family protein [Roseomonas aerilata]